MWKLLSIALCLLISQPAFAIGSSSNYAGYLYFGSNHTTPGTDVYTYGQFCARVPNGIIGSTATGNNFASTAAWVGMGGENGNQKLAQTGLAFDMDEGSLAKTFSNWYAFNTGGRITIGTVSAGNMICGSENCTANCVYNSTSASFDVVNNECLPTVAPATCLAATVTGNGVISVFRQSFTGKQCDMGSVEYIQETSSQNAAATNLYDVPSYGYNGFTNMTYVDNAATTVPSFSLATGARQQSQAAAVSPLSGRVTPSDGYGTGNNSFTVCQGPPGSAQPVCSGQSGLQNFTGAPAFGGL